MEQGSSSAKSRSTPSNQKKLSFTDELSAIVNSSSQNFSLEKESRYGIPETSEYRATDFEGALNALQSHQAKTSFSRGPLQGEMLSQFDGANVDLSAAYSYGNLHSGHQQLYQASQSFINNNALVSVSDDDYDDDEEPQNTSYYDDQIMNRYNLPLSNLPPEYHLSTTSSSGHRGAQIGSSQTLVPFESSMIDSSVNAGINNTYFAAQSQNYAMAPENLVPLRSMGTYQGIPYDQMTAPPGFEVGSNSLNNARTPTASALQVVPFESSIIAPLNDVTIHNTYSMQQAQQNATTVETSFPSRSMRTQGIPYPMNTLSGFDLGNGSSSSDRGPTTSAALKRKMPSQDDITPSYQNWNSSGRGLHRHSSSSSYSGGGRYTLYDKRYEEVGLPVDPHLRIFLARSGHGNGASSSRRND